ncbi:UDP-glucuronosyl/UDP-glucosyltransferase [Macleaya cordata]|uniref:UDP-glucuronosyl/UDP-glucosyltransferase n=1 Tax=Macleaya cordata TaxID=56857 RepID=A0A200QFY1_MACCD|nr:UDP-glucuronosyl/UDP-glucosyltransferase [Macleaya cordata]
MSNTTTTTGGGAHILVFPYPAQGHMIPLLDLTHQLAVRGRLTITILITPKNLPILNPLLSRNYPFSSVETLILPFPINHRLIPPGVENVKDLPPTSLRSMIIAMAELYDPLLHWFNSHPSPPVAIISDLFLGWTSHLASHLGIRRIVFSPSPAHSIAIIDSLWRGLPKINDKHSHDDPANNTCLIQFPGIPNSPVFPWSHLSPIYRTYREGDPDSEFIRDCIRANVASWGIVFNSFRELDSVYLDYMVKNRSDDESGYYDRVWAVGPLLPPDNDDGPTERGGSGSIATSDLLSWLDTCPDHSVVYVCFGSQVVLSNKQMEGLAAGLECSGARFLWCVKEATEGHVVGEYGIVPAGFEDRTTGRGMVVRGWVPQVLILRHRSVAGFLTHCGSNSMLESLAAGVVILAWPMGADQYSNAKLLVDQMKAGVRVCEGEDTVPDGAELGRVLAESVSGNRPERVRAMELRKAAADTVKVGGSSFNDLDRLVRDL